MSKDPDQFARIKKDLTRYFLEREVANYYEYLSIFEAALSGMRIETLHSIEHIENLLFELDDGTGYKTELLELKVEAEKNKDFTNLARQSFLASLYSFMELWLVRECYIDSKRRDKGESYRRVSNSTGLRRVKQYFSELPESDFDFESQEWQWITNFKRLRDCIVHRQGSLSGFSDFPIDPTLQRFVNCESGLSLYGTDSHRIFVEQEFCLIALQKVHSLMLKILSLHPLAQQPNEIDEGL